MITWKDSAPPFVATSSQRVSSSNRVLRRNLLNQPMGHLKWAVPPRTFLSYSRPGLRCHGAFWFSLMWLIKLYHWGLTRAKYGVRHMRAKFDWSLGIERFSVGGSIAGHVKVIKQAQSFSLLGIRPTKLNHRRGGKRSRCSPKELSAVYLRTWGAWIKGW